MKNSIKVLAFGLLSIPGFASAEIEELSQAELRSAVAGGGMISTRQLIAGVENFTGGNVVDIRAFGADSSVIYRVIVHNDDGQVSTLIVNGVTGHAISEASQLGRQIAQAAAANRGNSQIGNAGRSASARGRGNANNNGNGNRGGNGGSDNGKGR